MTVPREVVIANLARLAFWLVALGGVFVLRRRSGRAGRVWAAVKDEVPKALGIAVLYAASSAVMRPQFNLMTVAVFAEALFGLALARRVNNFEPLPVARAVWTRRDALKQIGLLVGIALLLVPAKLIVGDIGMSIIRAFFNEGTRVPSELLQGNKWLMFFTFLSGAGIAEETTFRLFALSGLWLLIGRRWPAVLGSAILFGAYHLSPLDGMYRVFWEFPMSQFLGSVCTGLLWGYVFTRRGYETAVLGHTLGNWIPLMLFA